MVHTSVFGMINEIPKDVENKYIELRVYRDEVDKKEFGYDIQRVDEYDSQILAYRDEYQSFQEKAIELRLSSTILQTYPSEDYHIAIRICDDYMCNSASYDHMYMISKDKKEEVEDFIRTWTEKGILESQSDPQVQGEEE